MTMVIAVLLAPLTLLTLAFAVELVAGLRPLPPAPRTTRNRPDAVIVVPAHNEEAILEANLTLLTREVPLGARMLLVADNCSDETAAIGRRLAVEVIERDDPRFRGKGYALDFAREHLKAKPPEIVVVIDADCTMDRDSITRLAGVCLASGRPCQATNLQRPVPEGSPAVQMSTFAFFIKNVIRQRGLQRLAGRVNLLGTGMAFPWHIFEPAELATDSIVEDLKLGQDLAAVGHAPALVENATVWSNAESVQNTLAQRRRWEGGFLQNALQAGPATLARALGKRDFRGIWAAVDISVPPLALLIFLDIAAALLATALTIVVGADAWPVLLLAATIAVTMASVGMAWRMGGSHFISAAGLCRAPLYVAWKLPLYAGFIGRGMPREWRRTERK